MRIEAGECDVRWEVWSGPLTERLREVVWVDTETNEYATLARHADGTMAVLNGELLLDTHSAKRMALVPEMFLVIVDPPCEIDDIEAFIEHVRKDRESDSRLRLN